jgi:hypothetical protein
MLKSSYLVVRVPRRGDAKDPSPWRSSSSGCPLLREREGAVVFLKRQFAPTSTGPLFAKCVSNRLNNTPNRQLNMTSSLRLFLYAAAFHGVIRD